MSYMNRASCDYFTVFSLEKQPEEGIEIVKNLYK